MGWAKYQEDIIEAITDAQFYNKVSNYETKSIEPPVFSCLYCNKLFDSKNALYEHIKKEHNSVLAMVVVNGKIVHSECFVKDIKSLIVIRYNLNDEIFIDKTLLKKYQFDNEIDMTEDVRQQFFKNKGIVLNIGEKEYRVNLISQEHINLEKINSIIDKWGDEISRGLHIEKNTSNLNYLERKCLDGLYNYFIACVSTGKNKENRYNDAYAILSEVSDILPAANFLLKIIAFKYNWIEKLRTLCLVRDVFWDIYNFMINKETEQTYYEEGTLQIFIEDELEMLIKSIIAYQQKNFSYVEGVLEKYPLRFIENISDVNNRDKICLLSARVAIINKKTHEARRFYNEIQSPFFESEIHNYIKNM